MTLAFRLVLPLLALAVSAEAQLVANLKLDKRQYIIGESVTATISVTNHSGRDIVFGSSGRLSWLDFMVRDHHNQPISTRGEPAFGTMSIAAGETMARKVNLTSLFPLYTQGNFSVTGVVRMPGQVSEATITNRVAFQLVPGRRFWTQKVGLASRPGEIREFRVLSSSDGQGTSIFAQVVDDRTGLPVNTLTLGSVVMSRQPMVTIDRQQRMHVLYLANPSTWVHAAVTTDGKLAERSFHQRGPVGDPKLMAYPDGTVAVSNSVPFNPEAAAEARSQVRKISDRPAFLYE